jgi:transposase-like protein
MSTIDVEDPPACPACNSAERVHYSASRQETGGVLVEEYICNPCNRVFTTSEAE